MCKVKNAHMHNTWYDTLAQLVEAVTGKKGKTLHVAWEPRKLVDMIVTSVRIENIFWNLPRIKRVTCCADARF